MGFIHGCNICNTSKDGGELNTEDLQTKIIVEQKINTNQMRQDSKMSSYEINKILTEMNVLTSYDIEFPPDILTQNIGKREGLKHEDINYDNGDSYQGTINKNNKKEGYGTYKTKNGFKYKTVWKDDKITDYGIFIEPEGNYIKGHIEGNIDGEGIIRYFNGSMYEGQFKNWKYEGKGKITFKNGGSYEGDFYNNLIHGKGKYIYPDGKIYEGNFQNGLKHGFGKISWNENKYFEGFWINNRQHGEGKYFLNGKILNAIFRYGKLIMKIG